MNKAPSYNRIELRKQRRAYDSDNTLQDMLEKQDALFLLHTRQAPGGYQWASKDAAERFASLQKETLKYKQEKYPLLFPEEATKL